MPYTVRRITELSAEMQDRPGLVAELTAGSSQAGVVLNGLVGYAVAGGRAVIAGVTEDVEKVSTAARGLGWQVERSQALLVEGDYHLGLLHDITQRLKDAGVNLIRLSAHAVAGRFHAWLTVAPQDLEKAEAALR